MLGQRAMRTTVISTVQHGYGQGLRFIGNVILAALLFPEAFGVMSLLAVFMQGLQMFSDIGIRPSIVQSKRGNDPLYLNTLWTIQVLRGVVMWLCAIPLGYFAANFYGNENLMYYMPVMALTALIEGFQATAVHSASRDMQVGRLAVLRMSTSTIKTVVMVAMAYVWPNIWVLVIGSVIHIFLQTIGTHVFLGGIRNRFCWDAESRRDATRFGRWIFISTMLTFFAGRSDTLILGKFMTPELFGLYSMAFSLAFLLPQAAYDIGGRVLFSLYSRLREIDKNHLPARTLKMRMLILAAGLPPIWILAMVAEPFIGLIYRKEYSETIDGLNMPLMIQLLSIGACARVITAGMTPVLLATGNSFGHMLMTGIEVLLLFGSMAIGGYCQGAFGLIVGFSVSRILSYFIWAFISHRHGIWFAKMDALAALLSAIFLTIALMYC
jgi:O-antigen/teichoic acid export membrane protein